MITEDLGKSFDIFRLLYAEISLRKSDFCRTGGNEISKKRSHKNTCGKFCHEHNQ